MNTTRQLIEQFLQFINTGDAAIGKPILNHLFVIDIRLRGHIVIQGL